MNTLKGSVRMSIMIVLRVYVYVVYKYMYVYMCVSMGMWGGPKVMSCVFLHPSLPH